MIVIHIKIAKECLPNCNRTGQSFIKKLNTKDYENERNKAKNLNLSINFQKRIGEIQEF
jgi:hypothetical protein